MGFFYWFSLFGTVLLTVLGGLFTRSFRPLVAREKIVSTCKQGHDDSSAFLCGKKMNIHLARITNFASIKGISLTKAQAIRAYLLEHPQADLKRLESISGIGTKTIAQLREHFY